MDHSINSEPDCKLRSEVTEVTTTFDPSSTIEVVHTPDGIKSITVFKGNTSPPPSMTSSQLEKSNPKGIAPSYICRNASSLEVNPSASSSPNANTINRIGTYYRCELCDFTSKHEPSFRRHTRWAHHDDEQFQRSASQCDRAISSSMSQSNDKLAMLVHDRRSKGEDNKAKSRNMKNIDDDPLVKCDHCDYTSTASDASRHARLRHGITIGPINNFECDKCNYTTHKRCFLKRHSSQAHGVNVSREMRCILCDDFATRRKADLKAHLMSMHDKTSNPKTKCPKCNYVTADQSALRGHIRAVHDRVKHLVCPECEFATSFSSSLRRHKRLVHKMDVGAVKTRRTRHFIWNSGAEARESGGDVGALEDPLGQLEEDDVEDDFGSVKSEYTLEEHDEIVVKQEVIEI